MPEDRARDGGHLVLVTGTGTGIGKTHVSEALLHAIRDLGRTTAGLKPIETGLSDEVVSDAARLGQASTFHVKRSPYTFAAPLSPHIAAREALTTISLQVVTNFVTTARRHVDVVLVELAGGLFTPITETLVNADLAHELAPDTVLLIAPDRLGVLHDVLATLRAASLRPMGFDAIVLVAAALSDPSTGRNAPELSRLLDSRHVVQVPRASVRQLATSAPLQQLAQQVVHHGR